MAEGSRARNINGDEFTQRASLFQKRRNTIAGNQFALVGALDVNALQKPLNGNGFTHGGNVSGHGAIAKGYQQFCALADLL